MSSKLPKIEQNEKPEIPIIARFKGNINFLIYAIELKNIIQKKKKKKKKKKK